RRAGDAEGEGEHGERGVGAAAKQPAQGELDVDGEALEHRFSWLQSVRRGLEAAPAPPPAAARERRQRAERLPPHPPSRGERAVRLAACAMLAGEVGEDLLTLA